MGMLQVIFYIIVAFCWGLWWGWDLHDRIRKTHERQRRRLRDHGSGE